MNSKRWDILSLKMTYMEGVMIIWKPLVVTSKSSLIPHSLSLWDAFVKKAKCEADKVIMIGRLNYFGTTERLSSGIWNDLKSIYCFDRDVDYRTPERDDGLFHVGAMATAWFVWERGFSEPASLNFLSVQEYAKLGNITGGSNG